MKAPLLPLLSGLMLALGACSSLQSPFDSALPQGPLRIEDLGAVQLTEEPNAKFRVQAHWEERGQPFPGQWKWRGTDAIGAPPSSFVAPVYLDDGDALVLTLGGGLHRVDPAYGRIKWTYSMEVGAAAKPLVLGGSVIVAGMDAKLRRLRLLTGELEWERALPSESLGGITAANGFVYVTTSDDSLLAVDEKTGNVQWNYKRPAGRGSVLWSLRGHATPQVTSDGKKLLVGFSDGYFVCLEATAGQTLWERNFDRAGRFKDADTDFILSKEGDKVFLPLVDGDLLALDTRDGASLWSLPGGGSSAPYWDEKEGVLYVSSSGGKVTKVDPAKGRVVWVSDLKARGMASTLVPLSDKYLAFTTVNQGVHALSRESGEIVLDYRMGRAVLAPPAFDGAKLLVLDGRNRLHRFRIVPRAG